MICNRQHLLALNDLAVSYMYIQCTHIIVSDFCAVCITMILQYYTNAVDHISCLSCTPSCLFYYLVAPSITDTPDDLTVVQPEDATFTCVATARPRPSITWWRMDSNGSLTQLMEEANVTSITEMMLRERVLMSNLTIESAQPSDADEYVCVAENEVSNTSATATLVVHGELLCAIASFTTSLMMQWFPPSPSLLMVTPSTPMSSPLQCSSAQPLVSQHLRSAGTGMGLF